MPAKPVMIAVAALCVAGGLAAVALRPGALGDDAPGMADRAGVAAGDGDVVAGGAAAGDGDAAAGEAAFRRCASCHSVQAPDGEMLAGRGARNGPNLWGTVGGPAGHVAGFRYSSALSAAAEAGLTWDAAAFAGFVQDPSGFLKDRLDDPSARSKMSFRLSDPAEAADLYAYLSRFGPGGAEGPPAD